MRRLAVIVLTTLGAMSVATMLVPRAAWTAAAHRGRDAINAAADVRLARDRELPAGVRVVWLGDSTMGGGPKDSYPQLVARRLSPAQPFVNIVTVTPGIDFFGFYCLMGDALALQPDIIVFPANAVQFTRTPTTRPWGEICASLPATELWHAAWLPLDAGGTTFGDLFGAQATRWTPLASLDAIRRGWPRVVRDALPWQLPQGRQPQHAWINVADARAPERVAMFLDLWRQSLYGRVPPGSPILTVMQATIAMARRAGVAVLVVGNPVPREFLTTPVPFAERFPIRRAVEQAGGLYADLQGILEADDFRDGLIHFTGAGAQKVAARVQPVLAAMLRARSHDERRAEPR